MQPVTRGDRLQAIIFLALGAILVLGAASALTGFPFRGATRVYFVEFDESVTGLDVGSPVRYRGVKKGKVSGIEIESGRDRVRVALSIDDDLLLTNAAKARFASTGLLGPYFIELYGANAPGATPLVPGSVIPADHSTMRRLLTAGTSGLEHLNELIEALQKWTAPENRVRLEKLMETLTRTLETADASLKELTPSAERLLDNWADAGGRVSGVLAENRESFKKLADESAEAAAGLRRYVASGRLESATDEAIALMETTKNEVRNTGTAFRGYLDENKLAPSIERAVIALEKLERGATSALAAMEHELLDTARGDMAPTLRSLGEAVRSLQELLAVLRNDPALLLWSEPRPEVQRPKPGKPAEPPR